MDHESDIHGIIRDLTAFAEAREKLWAATESEHNGPSTARMTELNERITALLTQLSSISIEDDATALAVATAALGHVDVDDADPAARALRRAIATLALHF